MTKADMESETSGIEQLPDDILLQILSFLTLDDILRTSILSRKWKNMWRYTYATCLNFNPTSVSHWNQLETSWNQYVEWVNNVIEARASLPGLPLVKELRIDYGLTARWGTHIDRWIQFAIENRIEVLHLHLLCYRHLVLPEQQYVLSEELWLRNPSGLSSLKCLKSLSFTGVNVSKQFIQFILSNCPFLEDLLLCNCGYCSCSDLDISGTPRLRQLKVALTRPFVITKLSAPCLTSLYYESTKFYPQTIDAPMLTDLTVGDLSLTHRINKYLVPFWSLLPQLEKLELIMYEVQNFKWTQMPNLVKLKYLKLKVGWDTHPIFFQIVNFINACPMLETFALRMFQDPACSPQSANYDRRKQMSCSFKSLKVLELYGGNGNTINQEIARYIILSAPHLEKLTIDTCYPFDTPDFLRARTELNKVAKAKAEKLCQMSCSKIKITIVE